MKLYAITTPNIPKHDGYLKISETKCNVDLRVRLKENKLIITKFN
jgi:hypothetical protein